MKLYYRTFLRKNNIKNLFLILLIIFFIYKAWETKNFIVLLVSIILINLYILVKIKKNLFKNIFLSTISFFFTFLIIESFLVLNAKNTSHFTDIPNEEFLDKKLSNNKNKNDQNSLENESKNIKKNYSEKEFFNYKGQNYFVKSKYGYLGNPGNYIAIKNSSKGDLIYKTFYLINNQGFRITPQSHKLKKNSTIVNFYGGSFTFGEGVKQNETLPAYLSELSKKNIIVNNYGFHGWGANSSLLLLKDNLEEKNYETINIFLTFKEHAIRSACKPASSLYSPKYKIEVNNKAATYVKLEGKCGVNFLPIFLRKILKKSKLLTIFYNNIYKPGSIQKEDIDLYYALIKQFIDVSTKNNCLTIIGVLPSPLSSDVFVENMEKLKKNNLVKIVDLRLLDQDPNNLEKDKIFFLHIEDKHPSALAHFERASILIKLLNL